MGFAPSKMQVRSSAFSQMGMIPRKHTGEGEDVSPELSWSDAPEGTKAFAVICHDPDAPLVSPNGTYGFVHWVLYNIPGNVNRLEEGTKLYTAGKNDYGKTGYGGPMPPEGHGPHHYYFWVLALSDDTQLEPGLTMWELLARIEPKVLGMNRLIGTYERG
ncbi:MAG: YbhB/YbcL family Raf kinase inhibitor-like protein [Pseudomonadota bacterium]|nr:MAG: YbhB/YbcL family Raf kinase inhibitor-like protein [Pseudomonadota bacterium]